MRKFLIGLTAALAIGALAVPNMAMAQDRGGGGGGGHMGMSRGGGGGGRRR
jgi:hypothetical protein